jgi:hypothetical protein
MSFVLSCLKGRCNRYSRLALICVIASEREFDDFIMSLYILPLQLHKFTSASQCEFCLVPSTKSSNFRSSPGFASFISFIVLMSIPSLVAPGILSRLYIKQVFVGLRVRYSWQEDAWKYAGIWMRLPLWGLSVYFFAGFLLCWI